MARGPVDFSSLRVLVVEHHGLMRRLLGQMLRGFGVRHVVEARIWAEALDRLYREPYDAAIIDFVVGAADGADLAKRVRHDPACRNREVPILLVAAAPDPDTVAKALAAGIDGMLAKPLAPKDLLARLCAILGRPRPFVITPDYAGPMRRRRSHALAALHEAPRPPLRPGAARPAGARGARRIVGLDESLFL